MVEESLAELSPGVTWKAETGSDKHVHISKEISKKSVAGAAWFLLLTVIAGGERLIEGRTYNLKKRNQNLMSQKILSFSRWQRCKDAELPLRKACSAGVKVQMLKLRKTEVQMRPSHRGLCKE